MQEPLCSHQQYPNLGWGERTILPVCHSASQKFLLLLNFVFKQVIT